jgi:hypothetical protein
MPAEIVSGLARAVSRAGIHGLELAMQGRDQLGFGIGLRFLGKHRQAGRDRNRGGGNQSDACRHNGLLWRAGATPTLIEVG